MTVASPSHETAELERNFKTPYSWIGMEALFYLNGDTSSPVAGIVTRVDDSSLLMTVFHPGTHPMSRTNVRHIDDPYIRHRPDLIGRQGQGAWDYSEGSREAVKRRSKPKVDSEVTQQILEMHAEGLNSSDISKRLNNGMNFQKVLAIIRANQ